MLAWERRGIYVNSPPPLLRRRQQRRKAKLVAKYRTPTWVPHSNSAASRYPTVAMAMTVAVTVTGVELLPARRPS